VKSSRFVRLSGFLAIIGALFLSALFLEGIILDQLAEDSVLFLIVPITTLFLGAGVAGLHIKGSAGRAGKAGLIFAFLGVILFSLGTGLMSWLDNENGWFIMMLGMLIHPFGLLLYGIPAFKRRSLPRWHATPLLVGLLAGPVTIVMEAVEEFMVGPWQQQSDLGFILWSLAIGIGWVMLGILLQTNSEEASARPIAA